MSLRAVPIRRVGNRHTLLMGCDREMLLMAAVFAAPLPLLGQTLLTVVFGLSLWFGALAALRVMGKADPRLRDVYLRHRMYRSYYPARATPFRNNSGLQEKRNGRWEADPLKRKRS